ncbi:kinase-like domain-containing protein [Phlyctochytrium arcticum]|nr:kinase-like domain-containing protein [Phlyctochytrium arcticum]
MIIRELGRGCHGKVKLCIDMETREQWALKIVQKKARPRFQSRLLSNRLAAANQSMKGGGGVVIPNNPELEKIKREIAILKKCNHPHVVGLKEVIDDPNSDKIYLVLEYLTGGDIRWHDQSDPMQPLLSIYLARNVFRDVICGVEYLHYQGIVHRDIKPANLLWTTDGRVKISDFGVSVVIRPDYLEASESSLEQLRSNELELAKTAGTPAFFAPEMCGITDDEEAIDIWAIGVTLYCLVFGRLPFTAESEFELFNVISRKPLTFPDNVIIDDDLKDLLNRLLDKDPVSRITLEEIKVLCT